MEIIFLFLYIDPSRIFYLKFLLEGHDGLAMLTTMDREKGLIRLAVPKNRYMEIMSFLVHLAEELSSKDNE